MVKDVKGLRGVGKIKIVFRGCEKMIKGRRK